MIDFQQLKPDSDQSAPLYLQLYRRYRDAISSGKFRPGDRVPSVRSLSSELSLARGTVEAAYQMLANEGYFVPRGAAGTVVSAQLDGLTQPARDLIDAAALHPAHDTITWPTDPLPFQLGLPALDAFPRNVWARLAGRSVRTLEMAAMAYPDPAGYEPLRHAISAYLGISRGIVCSPEQVFVTAGYRGALELIHRTLLKPGDVGWFEDPGYFYAREFLERAGMQLEPIPVDEEGLKVSVGQQKAPRARFVVVTPTHQSPTGVALSLSRRLELLEWAGRQAWIIEDDYDSEFRYQGRPLPALKSLDRVGRVLYTGTFSKVLFPGLRLGYLVVPASQVARFRESVNHLSGPGSIVLQATVADFLERGHFGRHLRKMRSLYRARRGYLVEALEQRLPKILKVQPQSGGIHILAKLVGSMNDRVVARGAHVEGLAIRPLSDWGMRRSSQGGLLMGFANFGSADDADEGVRRLRAVLARMGG